MDEAAISTALNACLVPDLKEDRFDPLLFAHLPDPFPTWGQQEALEDA